MKYSIVIVLVMAGLRADLHAWQNPAAGTLPQQPPLPIALVSRAEQLLGTGQTQETITLRQKTPFCMSITHNVSTATAKVGDRVSFRVGKDVSAEGLTVVAKGTEVGATISRVRKPRHFSIDGRLDFAFDDLPLLTGQAISIRDRRENEPPSQLGILIWIPPLVVWRGDDRTLDERECLKAETTRDISLDKAEVTKLQPPQTNWRTSLQQLFSKPMVLPDEAHLRQSIPTDKMADEIMEFDLDSGRERRIASCKGCFSPVAQPSWVNHFTQARETTVLFLRADGVYALYTHDQFSLGYYGNQVQILKGSFSAILEVRGYDIAVLEMKPLSCRILILSITDHPKQIVDSIPCAEATGGSLHPSIRVRSGQFLGSRYVGDVESQIPPRRSLVTGSLDSFYSIASSLEAVPIKEMPLSIRFDPTWSDAMHIVYLRKDQ
jgi:hypothetical protein